MIRQILKALFSSVSASSYAKGSSDLKPTPSEEKVIIEICEGFRNLAGGHFAMKQEGIPRPTPGQNQLLEAIIDAIYSPTSQLKTREMAESWAYENCLPIVTESEWRKKLPA
jgi:hypothetical protein